MIEDNTIGALHGDTLDRVLVGGDDSVSTYDILQVCRILLDDQRPFARVSHIQRKISESGSSSWSSDKVRAALSAMQTASLLSGSNYQVNSSRIRAYIDSNGNIAVEGEAESAGNPIIQPSDTPTTGEESGAEPEQPKAESAATPVKVQFAFRGEGIQNKPNPTARTLNSILKDIADMPKSNAISGEERKKKISEVFNKITGIVNRLNGGIHKLELVSPSIVYEEERIAVLRTHHARSNTDGVTIIRASDRSVIMRFAWRKEFSIGWCEHTIRRVDEGAAKLLAALTEKARKNG